MTSTTRKYPFYYGTWRIDVHPYPGKTGGWSVVVSRGKRLTISRTADYPDEAAVNEIFKSAVLRIIRRERTNAV